MPTVNLYTGPRHLYRPQIVEKEEVFSSPMIEYPTERDLFRLPGPYDVAAYLETLPPPFNNPSLVTVMLDPDNPVTGLDRVKCPKVLFPGDTHHGDRPIERRVKAALAQPWDLVVLEFCRQHCHWFAEAGVKNVAYIPCFNVNPRNIPPTKNRTRGISFVGQVGDRHPRRQYVIGELQRRGYPVMVTQAPPMEAAVIYNESAVSLNISLNGDFNYRNFEVMAAGGTLLMDKLASRGGVCQGVQRDFVDGQLAAFEDVQELTQWLNSLLDSPEQALSWAREGHGRFWAHHSPERKAAELVKQLKYQGYCQWADAAYAPPLLPDPNIFPRIAAYEALQERQRLHVADDPLVIETDDPILARDAADLHRLEIKCHAVV